MEGLFESNGHEDGYFDGIQIHRYFEGGGPPKYVYSVDGIEFNIDRVPGVEAILLTESARVLAVRATNENDTIDQLDAKLREFVERNTDT